MLLPDFWYTFYAMQQLVHTIHWVNYITHLQLSWQLLPSYKIFGAAKLRINYAAEMTKNSPTASMRTQPSDASRALLFTLKL